MGIWDCDFLFLLMTNLFINFRFCNNCDIAKLMGIGDYDFLFLLWSSANNIMLESSSFINLVKLLTLYVHFVEDMNINK